VGTLVTEARLACARCKLGVVVLKRSNQPRGGAVREIEGLVRAAWSSAERLNGDGGGAERPRDVTARCHDWPATRSGFCGRAASASPACLLPGTTGAMRISWRALHAAARALGCVFLSEAQTMPFDFSAEAPRRVGWYGLAGEPRARLSRALAASSRTSPPRGQACVLMPRGVSHGGDWPQRAEGFPSAGAEWCSVAARGDQCRGQCYARSGLALPHAATVRGARAAGRGTSGRRQPGVVHRSTARSHSIPSQALLRRSPHPKQRPHATAPSL
jgi:hypothetical protein